MPQATSFQTFSQACWIWARTLGYGCARSRVRGPPRRAEAPTSANFRMYSKCSFPRHSCTRWLKAPRHGLPRRSCLALLRRAAASSSEPALRTKRSPRPTKVAIASLLNSGCPVQKLT